MMTTTAKICGISTEAALDAALAGGASHVGLVFFAKSPRNVDLETARRLAGRARGKARIVALIVDESDARIAEIVDTVRPDMLQLHGRETPERVQEIAVLSGLAVIKAVAVASAGDVVKADAYAGADLILFDAKPPAAGALPGGNGVAFDWSLMAPLKGRMTFMLSGGLTAENVQAAIAETGAAMVDVSSGVESAPGVKDPELIRRFLAAVKTANEAQG